MSGDYTLALTGTILDKVYARTAPVLTVDTLNPVIAIHKIEITRDVSGTAGWGIRTTFDLTDNVKVTEAGSTLSKVETDGSKTLMETSDILNLTEITYTNVDADTVYFVDMIVKDANGNTTTWSGSILVPSQFVVMAALDVISHDTAVISYKFADVVGNNPAYTVKLYSEADVDTWVYIETSTISSLGAKVFNALTDNTSYKVVFEATSDGVAGKMESEFRFMTEFKPPEFTWDPIAPVISRTNLDFSYNIANVQDLNTMTAQLYVFVP